MTKSRLPNSDEIGALVAYLPRLYAPGFEPVVGGVVAIGTSRAC